MKLFYIANFRMPTEKAHGIQVMEMCNAFAKQGIEVELILPKRINKIKQDIFQYYQIEKNFKIKKLPCLDFIIFDRIIGILGLWVESFTFLLSSWFYLLFKKPDIIYIRDNLLLPLTICRRNIFFESHNSFKRFWFYLKKTKGIISITKGLAEHFKSRGINNQIIWAPDGVNLDKFNTRGTIDLPKDKKIVLYTGHLYKWKGVDVLLDTAKRLPDVLFIFVGGTEKDIESFKQKVKVKNVLIAGKKPHSEIPLWLQSADVLALPNSATSNISKFYTSPLKMFEYMAVKKPIIASDLPSLREVLNNKNSVLVAPDNPEALAEGIKKVLSDAHFAEAIAEQAFQDVQQYTWRKRAKKIINFIKQKNEKQYKN